MSKKKAPEPIEPPRMVVYLCAKEGKVCFITTDMKDAIGWKRAYGATIWTARMDQYVRLPNYFLS